MENYTTQMDAARKGIITPKMKIVAKKEHMAVEALRDLVAKGQVAICANKKHTCLNPEGVGSMLRTKIRFTGRELHSPLSRLICQLPEYINIGNIICQNTT